LLVFSSHWPEAAVADISSIRLFPRATVLACPRCSDMLYEVGEGDAARFCCDHGHCFTADEIRPGLEDFGQSLNRALAALINL
jgi:hypothetical protein